VKGDGEITGQAVRRVLIVDDHPVVVRGVRQAIDAEPDLSTVGSAETTERVLEHFAGAPPDVTIVDISLGSGSGLELIGELLARAPQARILVFSVHDEEVYAERALRAGARGYVSKNAPMSTLIDGIRAVARGEVALSPSMSQRVLQHSLRGGTTAQGWGVERLSDRELQIFEMIGQGHSTSQIAEQLGLSAKTVETHCGRIKQKLDIPSGRQLVRQATLWVEQEG
jgi:DNA-binding NarL/FixJ family response regulator